MKQILQHLNTGQLELAEAPCPAAGPGQVLIGSRMSLISAGTEKMLIEFGKANLIQKARQQPEKVKQVLDKIRADGLVPTLEAVFRKLDQPIPLGYCNAGVVLEAGHGSDLKAGDRVISNGPHADIVCVPRHLVARIPDSVPDEDAAFAVLGAIALQGVRLIEPTFGEKVVVFGLGLVGLLSVQFLRASGCEVLAIDLNRDRLQQAAEFGAQTADVSLGADPVAAARAFAGEQGADAALIAASAKTDDIVHQAAEACRKRGRIVLVGVVGLNLRRSDFYEKELTFQVSCSYGPGRYDEAYEQGGRDYPLGFVRWTENRNFEAVLAAMANGALKTAPLVTHRFPFEQAAEAYRTIASEPAALGVLLRYAQETPARATSVTVKPAPTAATDRVGAAVIGAGQYANAMLLPALSKARLRLIGVADLDGATAQAAARKFGAEQATTDYQSLLDHPDTNAVFVTTGHQVHARLVCEALAAGKHVFVEKPLCLNEDELAAIESAYRKAGETGVRQLMVGYNRRFSPHAIRIRERLAGRSGPLCMSMTVNAGAIPAEHWIQDAARGGGRIVGEACHFMDLLAWLAEAPIVQVGAVRVGDGPAVRDDKLAMTLGFGDGSVGTINYFANGAKSYPKERLEVFCDGRTLTLDNFRITRGYGFPGFRTFKTFRQDKGHAAEIAAFTERVRTGGPPLIPIEQLTNVTRASFAAVTAAREQRVVCL